MEDTISTREDMIERLRFCSNHLQDGDCYLLKEGDQVHAMNSKQVGSSYFDAVIVEVFYPCVTIDILEFMLLYNSSMMF